MASRIPTDPMYTYPKCELSAHRQPDNISSNNFLSSLPTIFEIEEEVIKINLTEDGTGPITRSPAMADIRDVFKKA